MEILDHGEGSQLQKYCQVSSGDFSFPHYPPTLLTQGVCGPSHSPSLMSLVLLESPLQEGCGAGGVFSVGSFC